VAGDVNVGEALFTGRLPEEASPPPILHEYGPNIRIRLAEEMGRERLRNMAAAPINVEVLNPTERLGYEAFVLRNAEPYAASKSARPHAGRNWDRASGSAPDSFPASGRSSSPTATGGSSTAAPSSAPAPRGTSDRLTGRIACGLIIVSGSHSALEIDRPEQTRIVAEIQNGLTWLGAQSPMKDITWVHDIQTVTITVGNNNGGWTYEAFEAPWRDAALQNLGLPAGPAGTQQYVNTLRATRNANWAFCALFTRYSLRHFAYATIGGPHLVMNCDCDGWGPDNLDRVFVHEVAHIFGAPDEYSGSGCDCTSRYGYFSIPNGNCETCAPNGGMNCIMRANTWSMCKHTPFHIGYNMPPSQLATFGITS
jgi:hypothetical protein